MDALIVEELLDLLCYLHIIGQIAASSDNETQKKVVNHTGAIRIKALKYAPK